MTNPAFSLPDVRDALQALANAANDAASNAGVSRSTIDLVGFRAS